MESIEYILEKSFEYSHQGQIVEAKMILLKAPTANNSRYTSKLKQGFFQAIRDFDTNEVQNDKSTKNKITGDEIVSSIMMSKSINFEDYVEDFKALMCKGIALIDGEEIFKQKLFEELSEQDLMDMLGVYLENFLISSLMNKLG